MASPISSKTRECQKLFAQLAESAKEPGDERDRFDKWSRNTGAHQKGSSSLDQRLQDASHIRDVVVELLDGLSDSLRQMLELSIIEFDKSKDTKSFASELLQDELRDSIHIIITSLLKLAIAVRNPAPFDRYIKSKAIDMSYYKSFDLAYLEELFPGIDGYLKERMAEATLQRRRFLEYSARHHFKLARDSPEETEGEGEAEADDTASLYAETNASTLPSALRQELPAHEAEYDTRSKRSSFTSYASSGMGTRSKVPPPPADAVLGGDPFECPYCHLLISPQDTYNWKKHVFHDLQPYVCTFENCENQDHLFRSRHEWFDHELSVHRREWVCPGHCDEVFSSQELFENHLAANYAESAGASLSALIKTCERPTLPSASVQCPFCLERVASRKKIRNHIGQHLADISLRPLPTTIEDTESSENEIHNESTASEHELTTIGEEVAARDPQYDPLGMVLKDLALRVEDWMGHKLDSFGKLLLHGAYDVNKPGSKTGPKDYEVYVFENIIICCRPIAIKKRWYSRDKDKGSKSKKPRLLLKGRIFLKNVTDTVGLKSSGQLQIWWRGDVVESFILDLKDEKKVSLWQNTIQQQVELCRERSKLANLSSEFTWMREDTLMPNPYAEEGESDDDEQPPLSSPWFPESARPPYPPTQLQATVTYNDQRVTLVISSSISYQALIHRIDAKLRRLPSGSIASGKVKLRYRDEDEDLVTVSNDEDLQLALAGELQHVKPTNLPEVNFICVEANQISRNQLPSAGISPIMMPAKEPIQE